MAARIERVSISKDVYDLRKGHSRVGKALTASNNGGPIWLPGPTLDPDTFVIVDASDVAHTLTYKPSGLNRVSVNRLDLEKGDDFTINWTTGEVTLLYPVQAGDVLSVWYVTSGASVAAALPSESLLTYAGTVNNDQLGGVPHPTDAWGMSGRTAGRRVSGVWMTSTYSGLVDESVADAYSAEATVTSVPAVHPVYFAWHACTTSDVNTNSGIVLQTDASSTTLYLYRNGVAVLSASAGAAPASGDDIKVVADFATDTATATKNGATIATLNFSAQAWYVAGGAP